MITSITSIALNAVLAANLLAFSSPPLSDVIKRVDPVEYHLDIDTHLEAYGHCTYPAEIRYEMNLRDTPLVFPVIPEGGFHTIDPKTIKARLRLDDYAADGSFRLLPARSLEVQYGRFIIKGFKGTQVDFHISEIVRSYAAKVDEKRAQAIDWPETWPAEVHTALQPQTYIDSTSDKIHKLMNSWTGGKPKNAKPYLLAKLFTRNVVAYFQVSGKSWTNDKFGKLDGIEVLGSERAVTKARGSSHDQVCLFVAVCRAAGLPARPVIGLDYESDRDNDLISWAEFYLPTAGWVSIDFDRLRRGPGTMRDLRRPWRGFGTNPDLNEMIPIAHHYHPPYGVRAEGDKTRPLLWGWSPRPTVVPVGQQIDFAVRKAAIRSNSR